VILWSVDPLDWKRPGPQVVSQRILKETQPGAIILSHDIHPGTIEAMPATFDALLAKGYKFVTVSELLAMESKQPASASKATESKSAAAPTPPKQS
jgi:peptidoglycan/xylan/chitin deacetylase (PgdA/CDA1 family)